MSWIVCMCCTIKHGAFANRSVSVHSRYSQSVVRCNRHRWPLYCTYVCDILCDVEVAVLLAKDTSIFVVELLVAKVAGSSYE